MLDLVILCWLFLNTALAQRSDASLFGDAEPTLKSEARALHHTLDARHHRNDENERQFVCYTYQTTYFTIVTEAQDAHTRYESTWSLA